MNTTPPFLTLLGLDTNADEREIKKAYARELKKIDQEKDLAGFQNLREAFEQAKRWAKFRDSAVRPALAEQVTVTTASEVEEIGVANFREYQEHSQEFEQKETDPISLTEQPQVIQVITPQIDYLGEQEKEGELACVRFLEAVAAIPTNRVPVVEQAIGEQMERALSDPHMVSLVTRNRFEQCVAQFLASGWKPRKELVLNVAITAFRWNADSQRLPAIPVVGRVLNEVLEERIALSQMPGEVRHDIIDVLQRLRYGPVANEADVIAQMYALEIIESRFTAMLRLMTNASAAGQWHEVATSVPAKSRKSLAKMKKSSSSGSGSFPWGIVIFIIITALRGFHAFLPSHDSQPALHYEPASSYSIPASSDNTQSNAVPSTPLVMPSKDNKVVPRPASKLDSGTIRHIVGRAIDYKPSPDLMNDDMVQYSLDLAPDGKIETLSLLRSSGNQGFDTAVRDAINKTVPTMFHGDAPSTLFLSYTTNSLGEMHSQQ